MKLSHLLYAYENKSTVEIATFLSKIIEID